MELEPKEVDPRQTDQEDTPPETTTEEVIGEEQAMLVESDNQAEVIDKPKD